MARTLALASLLLSCAAATAAFTPSAAVGESASGWQPPVTVTRGPVLAWDVAMGTRGRAVAAWYSYRYLMVARRVPGAGWLPQRQLAPAPDLGLGAEPSVAMNSRGDIAIVYQNRHRIMAIRMPARGPWQRPRQLLRLRALVATPDVSLGRNGVATAFVAVDPNAKGNFRMVALRSGPPGNWRPPELLGTGDVPRVVTGPGGRVTAAWWCAPNICAVVHTTRFGWQEIREVLTHTSAGLELSVDGTGRVYLATAQALVSQRPAGIWRREPVPPGDWFYAQVAAAGPGWAVALFAGPGRSGNGEVAVVVRDPSGVWTSPHYHATTQEGGDVATSSKGHAALISRFSSSPTGIAAARFRPETGWTPLTTVAHGDESRVLCGPDGRALLFILGNGLKALFHPAL